MDYTLDLPSTDAKTNKRLGYALPTSLLLPPYLASNPYFVDFTSVIDSVFDTKLRPMIDAYGNVRNMWVGSSEVEEHVSQDEMIPFDAWSIPDRELLVSQVNLLGMRLSQSGVVDDSSYLAISRFIGQYWLEKGKYTCIDFLNFCLSTDFVVHKLWTEDYSGFYTEDDPLVGTPVWEGGTWYPTTHISITANGGSPIDPRLLATFFYDVSNYNLVLWAVEEKYSCEVVTSLDPGSDNGVVAVALACDCPIVISNASSHGAATPEMNTFDWVSTQFYSTVGSNLQYYLGQATGWFLFDGDKRLPVYGPAYQALEYASSLPTRCFGSGGPLCGGTLVWIKVPGSEKSGVRLPAYVAVSELAKVNDYIESFINTYNYSIPVVEGTRAVDVPSFNLPDFLNVTQYVNGVHPRGYVGVSPIPLTSPRGLVEVVPHCLVPYW